MKNCSLTDYDHSIRGAGTETAMMCGKLAGLRIRISSFSRLGGEPFFVNIAPGPPLLRKATEILPSPSRLSCSLSFIVLSNTSFRQTQPLSESRIHGPTRQCLSILMVVRLRCGRSRRLSNKPRIRPSVTRHGGLPRFKSRLCRA